MDDKAQNPVPQRGEAKRTRISGLRHQYCATFILCLASFTTGSIGGWASPMIAILGSDDSPVGKMTNMEISPIETLPAVASLIGVIIFATIITKFGRKVVGYVATASNLGGLTLLLIATYKIELYIGRFLTGFATVGYGMVSPIYLSEVAYPFIRGELMTYSLFAAQCGSLVSYLLGIVCTYRWFTAIAMISPVLFVILFFWLPESPQYLLLQSKETEARDALLWYRDDPEMVDEELQNVSKVTPKKIEYRVVLQNRVNRKVIIVFLFLYIFNTMSGAAVIMSYASKIFQDSDSTLNPNTSAAILATIQFFASLSSIFIIDRTGRRFLVISSFIIMSVALVVTTAYFYLYKVSSAVNNMGWIPIVSLSTFIAANTAGVGSVAGVIGTEMLTPEVKGIVIGVVGISTTAFIFLSLQLYAIYVEYIGNYFNFLVEAVFSISAVFISWWIVPETKGKSIAEIVDLLSGGNARKKTESQETIIEE